MPGVSAGMRYRFDILSRETGELLNKIDPYGYEFERRPATASVVVDSTAYSWHDDLWIHRRRQRDWTKSPLSVYEVHLGSWQRDETGTYLSYDELAKRLVTYVSSLGFTHIELMPVTEHPLDVSWGYQPTGYFAPTSRYGTADDFRRLVDCCHQAGIGVILIGCLAIFRAMLMPWRASMARTSRICGSGAWRAPYRGTLVFDYNRNQVKNFLLASACFWLEECHLDGLQGRCRGLHALFGLCPRIG